MFGKQNNFIFKFYFEMSDSILNLVDSGILGKWFDYGPGKVLGTLVHPHMRLPT